MGTVRPDWWGTPNGQDPKMEPRVAVLEKSVSHIETDIAEMKQDLRSILRFVLGAYAAIAASALGLAGLMAKGFGWI